MSNHLEFQEILTVEGKEYTYYSLAKASNFLGDVSSLPYSLKILLHLLICPILRSRMDLGHSPDISP